MKRMLFVVSFLAIVTGGCMSEAPPDSPADPAPGEPQVVEPKYNTVDTDGDGIPDGIDIDGDGQSDVDLDALCAEPLVDADGDGVPDAIDLDCDGTPEIELCQDILLDADGDGVPDGVDLDCDGAADVDLGAACLPEVSPAGVDVDCDGAIDVPFPAGGGNCVPAPVDDDGDGVPDGIDLDCDGTADVQL